MYWIGVSYCWIMDLLMHGYYPNPTKCCLVVDNKFVPEATAIFGHLGIKIVTSHRFLDGFIGDSDSSM